MSKPIGWNCQKCAQDPQYLGGTVWVKDCTNPALLANAASVTCTCGTKCIPVFPVCDPPEPTTIDKSDLAPGMVVVAVDGAPYSMTLLATPDVVLLEHGETWALRMALVDHIDALWVAEGDTC